MLSFQAIILLLCTVGLPDGWAEGSRFEDAENFYYVGISSPSSDPKSAHNEAYQMALRSLVIEHFGGAIDVTERFLIGLNSSQSDGQMELKVGRTVLKGLQVVAVDRVHSRNLTTHYLLLAYPRRERDAELTRQRLNPAMQESEQPNQFIDSDALGDSSLLVTTTPSRADVYVDGEMMGKSQLQLSQLESKLVTVRVVLRDHEPYEAQVLLSPGEESVIEIALERSKGRLDLDVVPADAKVTLVDTGDTLSTSSGSWELPAGEHAIRFTHKNYLSKTETIYVSAHSTTYKTIQLEAKPSAREPALPNPSPAAGNVDSQAYQSASSSREKTIVSVVAVSALVGLLIFAGLEFNSSHSESSHSQPTGSSPTGGGIRIGGF